jgi:hypothetical protein
MKERSATVVIISAVIVVFAAAEKIFANTLDGMRTAFHNSPPV